VRGPVTAAALEAVEPASDGLMEAAVNVVRLTPDDPERGVCAVLDRPEVFHNLCRPHPSLLTAIELCKWTEIFSKPVAIAPQVEAPNAVQNRILDMCWTR
jgi:hypothetical protein